MEQPLWGQAAPEPGSRLGEGHRAPHRYLRPQGQLLGAALGLPGWGSHSSMCLCSPWVHGEQRGFLQALGCPEEPPVLPINNSQLLMSSKHPEGHN